MTLKLYADIALAHDLPEYGLHRGDRVRPLERHIAPSGEEGYSVEVLGARGRTPDVIAVPTKLLKSRKARKS
jgi:hypothetical protein